MKITWRLIAVLYFAVAVRAQDGSRVVDISQGPVKGYVLPNTGVLAFYGVPYATAPKGADKFKAPLPAPNWNETFEAVNNRIGCHQYGYEFDLDYTEDCLTVNVFVPNTDTTNLPVMFYIHGGGFQIGHGNWDRPVGFVDYKKNVIAVTFNYRLGPHGFMCLGTPDIPGNAGIRDQIAALKWVRDNIAAFGGNPDEITIAGCSAGGASVDLHMLSKLTKGMYKRVITQSGANIGAFAVQIDPTENAREYAKNINYDGPDDIDEIENFYKTISYERLVSYNLGEHIDVNVRMAPCLERDLGYERYLEDTPINIIKAGDYVRYPTLYGWANMEGLYRILQFDEWKVKMNEDFSNFLPTDLKFESDEQKKEVAQKVKEFYFGDAPVSNENVLSFIDYNSDVMFVVAMQRAITMQVEAGNTAFFPAVFSYVHNATAPIPHSNVRGVDHCVQADTVLDQEDEWQMTPEDLEMKRTMRDLWLNFIYYGEPTPDGNIPASVPKWNPAQADRTPCMDLGHTIQVLPEPYTKERQAFWDDLYDRFQRQPVQPYDFKSNGSARQVAILSVVLAAAFAFIVLN